MRFRVFPQVRVSRISLSVNPIASPQEIFMKKHLLAFAVAVLAVGGAYAQTTDTLAKVKASGTITMGVRDSSGALSYTLGDGKYGGYHIEICQRIITQLSKQIGKPIDIRFQPVTSQNRIPLVQNGTVDIECGSTTNNT